MFLPSLNGSEVVSLCDVNLMQENFTSFKVSEKKPFNQGNNCTSWN